MFDFQPIEEQK